jgi:septum formation protein
MELILASGSARRSELLKNCGYEFTVIKSEADESLVNEKEPAELVRRLSLLKARTVLDSLDEERRRSAVVLGSDTVVVLDGRVLGKPVNAGDAFGMLRAGSGRENTVYTGVAVVRYEGGKIKTLVDHDSARVFFAELSDREILDYIATGEPMDKAGAYGIQGSFSVFIDRIEGSYFTVVGLPVNKAYRMLKEAGIVPKAFE